METEITSHDAQSEEVPSLVLTHDAQYYLQQAARWARFLGILGFIGTGIVLLLALFMGTLFGVIAKYQPTATAMPFAGMGGIMSGIYVLIAVFYFFMSLYLYQFGSRIKSGLAFGNSQVIAKGLGSLKSHFKFIGITTIVVLALYALIFIVILVVGVGAATMMGR